MKQRFRIIWQELARIEVHSRLAVDLATQFNADFFFIIALYLVDEQHGVGPGGRLDQAVLLEDEAVAPVLALVDGDADLLVLLVWQAQRQGVGARFQAAKEEFLIGQAFLDLQLDAAEHVAEDTVLIVHFQGNMVGF